MNSPQLSLPNLVPEAILAVVIPFLFKLAGAVALWIAGDG